MQKLIRAVSLCAGKNKVKAYLVGGIVRDLILKKANFDLDIVVEADAIEFAKILSSYLGVDFRRHYNFKTATVLSLPYKIDLASARREFYPYSGSLPRIELSNLRDDLGRRDFSINAMALSLNKGSFAKLIDYFGGFSDLNKGVIRILHEDSFLEDPTRLFRAIRFKERFNFKFSPKTSRFLKQAVKKKALSFVNEHRLRDELVLILSEKEPLKCIRTLNKSIGFDFLAVSELEKSDFLFFQRLRSAVLWFSRKFPSQRKLEKWIIYLMGLFKNTPLPKLRQVLAKFGFRRGERIRLLSSKRIRVLDKLSAKASPSKIHKLLDPFSFETIIFFYALSSCKLARKNIEDFFCKHSKVRLKIKGGMLAHLGLLPQAMYAKVLKKILYKKIDGKITSKSDEFREAKRHLRSN
ncbi:MAG: CCA tRNA nucleotidyltransferase [Candidatus Omnitrophica bacterium]|nr:CCA tRNA nucleotidyltransferase [Candidatus Omnitrophota bacterium]